jgi:hypothetical protein
VSWRTLSVDPDRRRDVPFAIPDLDGWHRPPTRSVSPVSRSLRASLACVLPTDADGRACIPTYAIRPLAVECLAACWRLTPGDRTQRPSPGPARRGVSSSTCHPPLAVERAAACPRLTAGDRTPTVFPGSGAGRNAIRLCLAVERRGRGLTARPQATGPRRLPRAITAVAGPQACNAYGASFATDSVVRFWRAGFARFNRRLLTDWSNSLRKRTDEHGCRRSAIPPLAVERLVGMLTA